MTFQHPTWLIALVVPLALAIWEVRRRSHQIQLPFDHGAQKGGRWWSRLLAGFSLLPALLLAVAIVIACRPQRAGSPQQERELTNIEFVLDVSGSMSSPFGKETRYTEAMNQIHEFSVRRKGDAFGLTIFGNEVLNWTPLTKDLSAIENAKPFLDPSNLPEQFGGTEIGKALRFTHKTLVGRGEGGRMIVLLSDGISADLGPSVAQRIGSELAADDIVLYAIRIGDEGFATDLVELTRPTGGQVFGAENPKSLATVFADIDKMQPVRMKPSAVQPIPFFGPFAIAGLVLMSLYAVSLLGLRYTPW